jgi:two-component sensor histidine kinase/CHASE1-domain containing sensor protein
LGVRDLPSQGQSAPGWRPADWPRLSPWLVLAIGLFATALMAQAVHERAHARDQARFERIVGRSLLVINRGLEANATLLRGAAGFLAADAEAQPAAYRAYVDSLDLRRRSPGVRGVGFAQALPSPGARARLPGGVRIWPDPAKARSAIVLLEPSDPANEQALGYDMASEPIRAAAMAEARDGRRTTASGPVRLIQAEAGDATPGFLIYHPVFAHEGGGFLGWTYMPLRAAAFFPASLQGAAINDLADIEVFDGPPATGVKLYETARPEAHPAFRKVSDLPAFGRRWLVRVSSNRGFSEGPWSDALPVGVAGLALTFAVTFAFWLQSHALERALGAEAAARSAQANTEVLLKEVNHRVANSLQVVASLLDLQHDALKSTVARDALVETKARIMAVARVHQRLFASDQVGRVDLKAYLESLASELAATLDADGRRLKLFCTECNVDAAKAVSAGIVVAELVTNAFKYAYGQGIAGEVRIRLVDGAGQVRLSVEDDGVGFPPPGSGVRGTGLGMRIVRAMTQTLDGSVDMGPIGGGARVTLTFPSS